MKTKEFERMLKPAMMAVVAVVAVAACFTMYQMFVQVYVDTSYAGIIRSVNGSDIMLVDGRVVQTSAPDLENYCSAGQEIRIDQQQYTSVWCGGNPVNVNGHVRVK